MVPLSYKLLYNQMSYEISSQTGNASTDIHKTKEKILVVMEREREERTKPRAKEKIPGVTRTPGLAPLMIFCATIF